jgi:hypothetical protein
MGVEQEMADRLIRSGGNSWGYFPELCLIAVSHFTMAVLCTFQVGKMLTTMLLCNKLKVKRYVVKKLRLALQIDYQQCPNTLQSSSRT